MIQIIQESQYSWLIFLLLGILSFFAARYFYSGKQFIEKPFLKPLLTGIRFLVLWLVSSLLAGFIFAYIEQNEIKTKLLIAVDNSASMQFATDSIQLQSAINQITTHYEKDFQVDLITFGEKPENNRNINFKEKETNFESILEYINANYYGAPVVSTLFISDGIQNKGNDPSYIPYYLTAPFHTVLLGDTTIIPDIGIEKINQNNTVFIGNFSPIEVIVNAAKLKGKNSKIVLKKDNEILEEKPININSDRFSGTFQFMIEGKKSGVNEYRIEILPIENEKNTSNNSRRIYIEVIENKQKIILISGAPHPDLGAVYQSFKNLSSVECSVVDFDNRKIDLKGYDLVVVHGLPSMKYPAAELLDDIKKVEIPVWFIYKQGMNFKPLLNDPFWGISSKDLGVNGNKVNQISGEINPKFNLYNYESELTRSLSQFPPFTAPFGEIQFKSKPEVLAFQKIGKITTSQPVFSIHESEGRKIGFTLAEGLWRWRIQAYIQQNSHDNFNQFITKFAGALSLKEDKNPFKINFEKKFYENYRLQISAQIFNTLRETVSDAEINITVKDTGNTVYPYQMSFNGKNYSLDAGFFNPGKYTLTATAKTGDKEYKKQFVFNVLPLDLETIQQNANPSILKNLSAKYKGEMLYGINPNEWIKLIDRQSPPKTILVEQETLTEFISLSILGIVILLLISLEWLLRKYYGAY